MPDRSRLEVGLKVRAASWSYFPIGVDQATDGSTSSAIPFEVAYNQFPDLTSLERVAFDTEVAFGGTARRARA